MKDLFKYSSILILLTLSLHGHGQNQASKWYFGFNGGMDFTTNPPSVVQNGQTNELEATSCISDAIGNLLFYTDGDTVWNKNHQIMANGTGLLGTNTPVQGALIIKQPGNNSLYIIFTADGQANPGGLNYSIVDMSLAAGLGSVTIKNFGLVTPTSEKLTATYHCNRKDIWVMSHDMYSNVFRAYLVTSAGVSTSPVLSGIGTIHSYAPYGSIGGSQGFMKFSPSGRKLALAICDLESFELYNFDAATGVVSNSLVLGNNFPAAYSVEFSPDEKNLYGTRWAAPELYQWNLCAGSGPGIVNSMMVVGTASPNTSGLAGLQLGPDNKIYIARSGAGVLGRIDNPNVTGTACNFVDQAVVTSPGYAVYTLPNFMTSYPTPLSFTSSVNNTLTCLTGSFFAPVQPSICAVPQFTILAGHWVFGDPGSGSANTSTLTNPTHVYPGGGTYLVSYIYTYTNSCVLATDTIQQQLIIPGTSITSVSGFTMCSGQSLTLTALGNNSYTWSTGDNNPTILVSPTITTTYSVNANCLGNAYQTVTVYPKPDIQISGVDTICQGKPVQLNSSGAITYTWDNGSLQSTLTDTPVVNTTYTVTGTDIHGCQNRQTINIIVLPGPTLSVSGNTSICAGSIITQTVNGAQSYTWSNGTIGNVITFTPSSTLFFTVTGVAPNGCLTDLSETIVVKPLPLINIPQPSVCEGSSVTLHAQSTDSFTSNYTWDPGNIVGQSITIFPTESYVYTVVASYDGCSSEKTVAVILTPTSNPVIEFSYPPMCENSDGSPPILIEGFSNGGVFSSNSLGTSVSPEGFLNLQTIQAGTYNIEYSFSGANCVNPGIGVTQVTVLTKPNLIVTESTRIKEGSSITLTVTGGENFKWSPENILSCSNCTSTIASPPESAKICVSSTLNSCISQTCIVITVGCENFNFSFPTAFSPNGDGTNDAFCLQGWNECISDFHINIFNRWGENIYESSDPSFCWDGTYKGQKLNSDVFVYIITASRPSGPIHKKGNITLLR
ncbi:MAG: gliding motility-associated C-terminal domain-containing protein [Bacteroidia bacterium]|nr:gliding motility-associated C-terminal domain-containing protein [Bacteroidia bacterium]